MAKGVVKLYRSDRGWGLIVDAETRQELRFERKALEEKGWTPASKAAVEYLVADVDGQPTVVRVRRVT